MIPGTGFGQPLNPSGLPTPPVETPAPPTQPLSQPLPPSAPNTKRGVIRDVSLGYSSGAEAPQLPAGFSSKGSNFVSLLGGLTPRPGLSLVTTVSGSAASAYLSGAPALWLGDYYSVQNDRYPVAIGKFFPAVYTQGSWSTVSQSGSSNTYTLTGAAVNVEAGVYYDGGLNANHLAFLAPRSTDGRNLVYSMSPSVNTFFSFLTGSPAGAQYMAMMDNRIMLANMQDTTPFPQRIQWSGRGTPQTWAAPDGGAEDLEDAGGTITRIMTQDDRLLVWFQGELWQGLKASFPYNFEFIPLDRGVGTRASWSVAQTPFGPMFLGQDMNIYVVPRGGTPTPVLGKDARRFLLDTVLTSNQSIPYIQAQWMTAHRSYLMTFQAIGGGQQGIMVNLDDPQRPQWSPLGFDAANFVIARLGTSSIQTAQRSFAAGAPRIIASDLVGNVMEFSSAYTSDMGTAIDCRYLTLIPNPDPTTRQHVQQVRVDYRATSASSLSLRMTPDFGTTYPVDVGLGLPPAGISAQTIANMSMNAIYPGVEFRHASGHTFFIQGISVVADTVGNG